MKTSIVLLSVGMLCASASVGAVDLQGLKDKLGGNQASQQAGGDGLSGMLGGAALPGMNSSVGGNAAGVLQYCIKNNYLAGGAVGIKDKLLSKVSGQSGQDSGYKQGEQGMLSGSDGKSLDLKSVSGKVKHKACDYVLQNAKSMI